MIGTFAHNLGPLLGGSRHPFSRLVKKGGRALLPPHRANRNTRTGQRGAGLVTLLAGLALTAATLAGQAVQFAGIQSTVGSGLNQLEGVAVDAAGDVFIADADNNRVLEVTPNGTYLTLPFTTRPPRSSRR